MKKMINFTWEVSLLMYKTMSQIKFLDWSCESKKKRKEEIATLSKQIEHTSFYFNEENNEC